MRDFAHDHPTWLRAILLALAGALVLCGQMAMATPLEVVPVAKPSRAETKLEAKIIAAQQSCAWDLRAANYNIEVANESRRDGNWSEWSKRLDMAGVCLQRAMKSYWRAEKLQARLEKWRQRG